MYMCADLSFVLFVMLMCGLTECEDCTVHYTRWWHL